MNRNDAAQALASFPYNDPGLAFSAGIAFIKEDFAELILPAAIKAARKYPDDARIQQLHGLAARIVGDSRAALIAFSRAAKLAPSDPLIAHSHARAALEAGKPAIELFDRARSIAPSDGGVLLGRTAAQIDQGQSREALADLTAILTGNPLWTDGHRSLAHLRGQMGLDTTTMIDHAVTQRPQTEALHQMRVNLHLEEAKPDMALKAIAAARAALGEKPWVALYEAHATAETGDPVAANHLFDRLPQPLSVHAASLHARNLLRLERADAVVAMLQPFLPNDREHLLIPYITLAWRMLDDPKADWLQEDTSLVKVIDIGDKIGDIGGLAQHLRMRHFATAAPLDQSVRGGTQTDGNLLLRDEPPLRRLKQAILSAVDDYVAQLPSFCAGHPTLIQWRDQRRIAGSWSVRLEAKGFHTDHVHSHGWISSALYIETPSSISDSDDSRAGWLALGAERNLVPSLAPLRSIMPKPGRLVLFPSTMWHGTNPFPSGERLTVAFDIARPRQC